MPRSLTAPASICLTSHSVICRRGSGAAAASLRSWCASTCARCPGCSARARSGSSGRAQPNSQLNASRSGPYVRCHPGGAMFRLFPVSRSTRAARMCTCAPPPRSRCSTADHAYRSGSKPAHAVLSNSSSTRPICSSVGASSGAHAITPAVYLCLNSSPSATAAAKNGSPRSTSTPSRGRPAESRSPTRYSAAPPAEPVPRARNLTCIPHLAPPPRPRPASSPISRSIASRCAITCAASAAPLYVFAHRAIWFRLFPIRATCRVRSRSASAAGAVHVRVRPIARRASSDGVTPAAAAFAFHAARSAAVSRTVRNASRLIAGRLRAGSRGGAPSRAGGRGGAPDAGFRGGEDPSAGGAGGGGAPGEWGAGAAR